jgi:phosphatidylglycerophosphatase A
VLATGCGVGYAPLAPGTAGSALAAAIVGVVPFSRAGLLLFFLAVTVAGTWAAHRTERRLGVKDPGAIVIDEVAGMTLAVLPFPPTPAVLIVGFVLFRIFDVTKPFPARASQRVAGGIGVMVDDLIAGLYALAAIAIGRATLAWP